jgi:hypothetical protein
MDRPRVFCDFNKRFDAVTYGLNTIGTRTDAERLGIELHPGLALTVYDHDAFDNGDPAWIMADGVVVQLPSGSLAIEVEPPTFRWEPREA